jgi:hypothetical protein
MNSFEVFEYNNLQLLRSDDGLIRARSVEEATRSPRRISAWIASKRGREILANDPEAFVKKSNLGMKLKGYYLKQEYLDEYIEWLTHSLILPNFENDETVKSINIDRITSMNLFKDKECYGLLIFYDEQDKKIYSYVRRNFCFRNDPRTRKIIFDKSYLLHINNSKEEIVRMHDEIMNEISTQFSITKRLQGLRRPSINFNFEDLDQLREILAKYE